MTAQRRCGPGPNLAAGGFVPSPGGWPMRTARAGIFASSSVALAVGAHRLGGGLQPSRDVVLAAAALLFAVGLAWSRRERGGPAITGVVLVSQLAAHAAFAFAPMPVTTGDRAGVELNRWAAMLLCHNGAHPATAAQVNAARAALGLGPLPPSAPMHMAGPLTTGGAGMLAMHLGAALVMAWWLRRGESAAWAVARRVVAAVVCAGDRVVPVLGRTAASRPVGFVWTPRRWTFGAGLAGRGPPRAIVVALTA